MTPRTTETGLEALIKACENVEGTPEETPTEGGSSSPSSVVNVFPAPPEKGQTAKVVYAFYPYYLVPGKEDGEAASYVPAFGNHAVNLPIIPMFSKPGDEIAPYTPVKQKWTRLEESLLWGILVNRIAFSGSWIISQALKQQENQDTSTIFWNNIAAVFNPLRARFIPGESNPRTAMSLKRKLQKLREDNKEKEYTVLPVLSKLYFANDALVKACFKDRLYRDNVHHLSEEELITIFDEDTPLEQNFQRPTRNTGYTLIEEVLLVHCVFRRLLTKGSLFPKRKDEMAEKNAVFNGISESFEEYRKIIRSIEPKALKKQRGPSALQRRWKTLKGTDRVPFLFKTSMELNFEDLTTLKAILKKYE